MCLLHIGLQASILNEEPKQGTLIPLLCHLLRRTFPLSTLDAVRHNEEEGGLCDEFQKFQLPLY